MARLSGCGRWSTSIVYREAVVHRAAFVEEAELGWRAAGAIERENEGPTWMRRHIISFRFHAPNETQESPEALRDRPRHQMM